MSKRYHPAPRKLTTQETTASSALLAERGRGSGGLYRAIRIFGINRTRLSEDFSSSEMYGTLVLRLAIPRRQDDQVRHERHMECFADIRMLFLQR